MLYKWRLVVPPVSDSSLRCGCKLLLFLLLDELLHGLLPLPFGDSPLRLRGGDHRLLFLMLAPPHLPLQGFLRVSFTREGVMRVPVITHYNQATAVYHNGLDSRVICATDWGQALLRERFVDHGV